MGIITEKHAESYILPSPGSPVPSPTPHLMSRAVKWVDAGLTSADKDCHGILVWMSAFYAIRF